MIKRPRGEPVINDRQSRICSRFLLRFANYGDTLTGWILKGIVTSIGSPRPRSCEKIPPVGHRASNSAHNSLRIIGGGVPSRRVSPNFEFFHPSNCQIIHLETSRSFQSAFTQVLSGLYSFISPATLAVSEPRSFSKTTPSRLTRKVITPLAPYSAGKAIIAKPSRISPLTR
jgi:hypothetical protein